MGDTFDELPADWTEFADEGTGSSYYYNAKTKRNTWTRPEAERVTALARAAGGGAGMRAAIRRASQACAVRRSSTTQVRGAKSTMKAMGRKKKAKKKKKKKKKSGERGIVTEACSDLSKHKKFGQMLNYSLTTLIGNIEPGHSGWEDNLAQFLQEGGLDTLDDIIAIHSAKGNDEVVELAERLRAIVEENKRAVLRALRLKRSKPCLRLVAAMVVAQPIEAVDLVLNAGEGTIGAVLSMLNESGHDIEVANPALAFLDQIAKDSEGLFVLKNADGFEAVLGWILKNYDAILADIDNPDVEDSFGVAAANAVAILAQLAGDDEGLAKKLSEVAELRSLIDTVMDYRSNAIPPLIASCLELLTKMPGGYVDLDLLRKILDLIERNGGALGSLCADPRIARAFCMLTATLQGPKYGMDPNSAELRHCRKIIEGLKGVHDDLEDLCEMLADPESAMLDELDNMCAILRRGDVNGGDVLESFEKMKEISRLVPGAAPEASTAQLELLLTSFADYQSQDEIAVPILRTLMLLATNPKNIDALASLNGIEQLIRALRENPANLRLLQILIQLLEKFVFHDVFKRRVGELGGCEALVLCLRRNCEPDLAQSEVAPPPPGPPGRARPVSEAIVSVKGDLKDHDILMVALLSLLANMCYNCPENIAHIIARGRSTGTDLETDGIEAVGHTIETFMNKAQIVRAAAGCLANCMTGDDAGVKEKCGERCGTILVQALTAMPDNVSMFQQCVRAFGNMSQSDDNIRLLCQARCVSAMVAAMTYCLEDEGTDAKASSTCLSSAITVLGWFAEASEDVGALERYDTDHTVASAIFKQGGAHAMLRAGQTARDGDSGLILSVLRSLNIVCDDAKTAKKLMKEGEPRDPLVGCTTRARVRSHADACAPVLTPALSLLALATHPTLVGTLRTCGQASSTSSTRR
jgi:hypothetical protein